MVIKRATSVVPQSDRRVTRRRDQEDPPIRLAHFLFVLWGAGSVAWAFFAATFAHDEGWWVQHPELAAVLVLAPPILAHLLANRVIRVTGNPRFRR